MKKLNKVDFIQLLLQDFDCNIESKKLASSIMRAFPVNFIYLEKDLSNLSLIDFSLPFFREKNDFSFISDDNIRDFDNHPTWRTIISSIRDISVNSKYSAVDQIWLEFDANGFDNISKCAPGFYFGISNSLPERVEIIIELLFKLRGGLPKAGLIDKILNVINNADSSSKFLGIGLFLGRRNLPIRLGYMTSVRNVIQLSKNYPINSGIIDFLKSQQAIISDTVNIHFNITEEKVSIQGIEIYSSEKEMNWELIFNSLAKFSFCDPRLKPQVLQWNNSVFNNNDGLEHEIDLGSKSNLIPEYFSCSISHFKLVNSKRMNLKVYHYVDFINISNNSK